MKILRVLKNMFDKKSSFSSKRFLGVSLGFWFMLMATYYITKVQLGGNESNTTVMILEFSVVSACGLLAGGTLAEAVGSNIGGKKKEEKKEDGKG